MSAPEDDIFKKPASKVQKKLTDQLKAKKAAASKGAAAAVTKPVKFGPKKAPRAYKDVSENPIFDSKLRPREPISVSDSEVEPEVRRTRVTKKAPAREKQVLGGSEEQLDVEKPLTPFDKTWDTSYLRRGQLHSTAVESPGSPEADPIPRPVFKSPYREPIEKKQAALLDLDYVYVDSIRRLLVTPTPSPSTSPPRSPPTTRPTSPIMTTPPLEPDQLEAAILAYRADPANKEALDKAKADAAKARKEFKEQKVDYQAELDYGNGSRKYFVLDSSTFEEYKGLNSQRTFVKNDIESKITQMSQIRNQATQNKYDLQSLQLMATAAEQLGSTLKELDARFLPLIPVEHQSEWIDWAEPVSQNLRKELLLVEKMLLDNEMPISDLLNTSQMGNVTVSEDKDGNITTSISNLSTNKAMATAGKGTPKITDKDLEMIKFMGKTEDHDRFVSSAHDLFGRYDASIISWIRKFGYLKQCLPEKEQKKLLTYSHDSQGYTQFWSDLKLAYGTKTDQVFFWRQKLQQLPRVEKNKTGNLTLGSLKKHWEDAKVAIRYLGIHGKPGKQYWQEFLPLMVGKLDQGTALDWGMYSRTQGYGDGSSDADPIEKYLEWIKIKIDVMTTNTNDYKLCNPNSTKKSNGNGKGGGGKNGKNGKAEVETNSTGVTVETNKTETGGKGKGGDRADKKGNKGKGEIKSTNPKNCPFHPSETHMPWKCKDFGKGADVWNKIYASPEQICICCLRASHVARRCPAKKECGTDGCKKHHHQKLHQFQPQFRLFKDWKAEQQPKPAA